MTTLLKSASEREAMLHINAEMPEATGAAVDVVILAGSFNEQLVADIHAKNANDTIERDSSSSMLRRAVAGFDHVPPGLQFIGSDAALTTSLAHLLHVHQLNPLTDSLYVVTNAANHEEFVGRAAFFDGIGRFPKDWQHRQVVCNGAAHAEEWRGAVVDLQLALRATAAAAEARGQPAEQRDVVVIDANLFFWPAFPLQKVVSNMIIRAQPAVALHTLTATDAKLYAASAPSAAPTEPGQVPRIGPIAPASIEEGSIVVQPLAFVPAACTALVHEAPDACTTLPALFAALQATGTTVYGVHLPPGLFNLSALLPQRYVQQHMLYAAATRKRMEGHESARHSEADTILSLLQECDHTGLGRSRMMDPETAAGLMRNVMADKARDFDRHFFAMEATKFRGYQRPAYKLPATFYMSAYRSQSSEAVI